MAENFTQANSPMKLTTPLGPDNLLLTGLTVREGMSQLFQIQVDAVAPNKQDIAFDKLLGQKASIEVALPQSKKRFFNGVVARVGQGGRDETFTTYRLELVPQFWLLTRRWQSRIFQQMSAPDILKKVLTGFDVTYEIQGTFEKRDYCVQYRESDFNFASRLMEEEGIYYFYKHTQDGHKMVLANTPQSNSDMPDQSTVIFDELAGGNREEMRAFSWGKLQELRSGKYTLFDHSFELPHKHLDADKTIADSVQVGTVTHKLKVGGNDKMEIYDYPGEYAQRFDGINPSGGEQADRLQKIFEDNKRTVAIRMEQETAPGIIIQGASNCRNFSTGFKFTLDKHFNANGPYLLTAVTHVARQGNFRSNENNTFEYSNNFVCIPFATPFRPQRTSLKPVIQGTQTAVVVGPPNEEIFTDKYGRVKVQFHWDREGKNDANSSCWLRVATPWAGQNWGMIHIPRVGQEVVVIFEEGDPDQPLIIGSVYNPNEMPPYKLPDHKTQSGVKSRSTLKGTPDNFNELRFEDKKGSEDIYFHAEKDFHRVVENNDFVDIGAQKHGEGNQTINIANNQLLSIGVPAGDGANPALGSQIIEIWNNREITIGAGKGQCADGSELVAIWKNQEIKIGAGEGASGDGSQIVEIYKDRNVTLDTGNDNLVIKMGNQTTKLNLGASSTEALQSIELKVGQSSIKIDQTGVSIQGLMVNINGQVQTNIKGVMTSVQGTGMLAMQGGITMIN